MRRRARHLDVGIVDRQGRRGRGAGALRRLAPDRARPDRSLSRDLHLGAARPPAAAALERRPGHAAGRRLPSHAAHDGAGRRAVDRGWCRPGRAAGRDARRRAGRARALRGAAQAARHAPAGGERRQPHALPSARRT